MSTMTVSAALSRGPRAARVARTPRSAPQPQPVRLPVPAGPAVQARQPARLTRRGRLAVTLALVAVSTGLLGLAQPQAFALSSLARGRSHGPATARITVHPGETLWAIAGRVAPNADPRSTIARLESMNHLGSSTVPAGSVLLVPAAR